MKSYHSYPQNIYLRIFSNILGFFSLLNTQTILPHRWQLKKKKCSELFIITLLDQTTMGCICSFFKTLTSYHGSHLTAHQVSRQRQQRARKLNHPSRDSPPPMTPPEKDTERATPPPLLSSLKHPKGGPVEEERLLTFTAPHQKHKLGDCGKQTSFSQSKFGSSFAKP